MRINTKTITRVAVFGTIATLLYCFISFPFGSLFLPFYKFNFSDVPALIAGFAFGPLTGGLIQVVKVLLSCIFMGSGTSYVGEFSDLVLGLVMVVPAALYYKSHRNIKGALIGSLISSLIHIAVAFVFNYFILLPFYANLWMGGFENLVAMINGFYKNIEVTTSNAKLVCVGLSTTPFNLLRNVIIVVITFVLYKRLAQFIKYVERTTKIENSVVHADPIFLTRLTSLVVFLITLVGAFIRLNMYLDKKSSITPFIVLGVVSVVTLGVFILTIVIEKKKTTHQE